MVGDGPVRDGLQTTEPDGEPPGPEPEGATTTPPSATTFEARVQSQPTPRVTP